MKWFIGFLVLSLVAVFTSQSLVDLADILITFGGLIVAFKQKEIATFFKGFKPSLLWPLWLAIVIVGLFENIGFSQSAPWIEFLEFRWILTFLAIIYLAKTIDFKERTLQTSWAWTLLVLNLVAIVLFIQDPYWRVQGILKATMSFSHNIAPLLCLYSVYLLGSWKELKKSDKILVGAVILTSAILTLFTFTRGVWIGSFAAILTALFIWNKKLFTGFLVASVLGGSVLVLTNQRIHDRVFNKTRSETESNDERRALWKGNWRIIEDYPLLGVGFQQNKHHLRKYYDEFGLPPGQRESHAHNQYLQFWAGTGTLGFICFLVFFGLILKKAFTGYRETKDVVSKSWQLGLFAAILCFMVGALTESNFNIAKNRLTFLILAGLAVAQTLKPKKLT